ncbi:MAG: hypothetical protein MR016_06790 [Agathobacter sp.]|nr:hypothetical protein [Agathobacter sp.]
MQYTLEEILDLIGEALGAIFIIIFCQALLVGDFPYSVSKLVGLVSSQVLGG